VCCDVPNHVVTSSSVIFVAVEKDFFSNSVEQIAKVSVKSVTDRPFIFGVLLAIVGVVAAVCKVATWVTIVVLSFACLLILLAVFFFIYFAIKNPNYLRSEEHQRIMKGFEILGDDKHQLNVTADNIVVMANPHAKSLPEASKEEGV